MSQNAAAEFIHSNSTEDLGYEIENLSIERLSEQYGDHVRSVLIFGSKARGDARADSDIDVPAVLNNDAPRLYFT